MKKEYKLKNDIFDIYKILLTKNLSQKEIEKLYLEYLKVCITLGTNKPMFNENKSKYKYTNCYGYALGVDRPKLFFKKTQKYDFNIGDISNRAVPKTEEEEIDNLYNDLNFLGVKYFDSDIKKENEHGGYKIALYRDDVVDFHFIRQNANGIWSDKLGFCEYYNQMEEPFPPTNDYKLVKVLEIVKPVIK